jgi:hypothetical protein
LFIVWSIAMYGTPPKYRNPKLIPVSPELDAWLTGKEYIKAEPVPPLGSTVVIVCAGGL